ncbi:MAG TPA: hypothetical protein VFN10_12765, partial [Thermoanaerobaculia bacterium]|nr:hypothetical protein [Thermoanaerobaculia bacterium]
MLRRRILPHAIYFFVFWPIGSALFAVLAIREQSVMKNATATNVLLGTLAGTAHLLPEFLWCALLLTAITVSVFTAMHVGAA